MIFCLFIFFSLLDDESRFNLINKLNQINDNEDTAQGAIEDRPWTLHQFRDGQDHFILYLSNLKIKIKRS